MSGEHVNHASEKPDAVTRRMQQSRREIELLKAEYERLLEQGIQGRNTSNITDTDKQKEIQNKKEEKDTTNNSVRGGGSIASSSTSGLLAQKRVIKRKPPDKLKWVDSSRQVSTPASATNTKVRHYNVDDARDYIKKQREKRLLQQRQLKETDNAIELKRQKLKELHQRSLQIVARNRERSKSREKQKLADAEVPAPPTAPLTKTTISSKSSVNSLKSNPHPRHVRENVTYRADSDNKENKVYVKSSAKSDDAKIKAATQIQAYYRGYLQRKTYKDAFKTRSIAHKLAAEAIRAQKQAAIAKKVREEENLRREAEEKLNREAEEAAVQEKQRQKDAKRKKLPEWLQPVQDIHPYNFITSVKRKLNVALNTPVKTTDVAVQSSFSLEPNQQTPPESYKEVRNKIERSLSNKKPIEDKQLNVQIEKTLKAIKDMQMEPLVNGQGKCAPALDLNAKRLDKMKLGGDFSDSDTSKNIPDISFESHSHKTSSSKTVSIPSESVIFIKPNPKEPPPKPKRVSRLDSISRGSSGSRNSQSVCSSIQSESQKEASSAQEKGVADLQLRIDRLIDIKLQRRADLMPDNTIDDLQPLARSSNSSRFRSSKDKRDKPSHKDNSQRQRSRDSSTSSINTISIRSKTDSQGDSAGSIQTENPKVSEGTMPHSAKAVSALNNSDVNSLPASEVSKHNGNSVPYQYSNGSMGSRRDSTISRGVSQYTRSFEPYKDTKSKSIDESIENSGDLKSFIQYMKGMDESKIMHTPFQPKRQLRDEKEVNPEQRLKEVIVKVNDLHEELTRSDGEMGARIKTKRPVIENMPQNVRGTENRLANSTSTEKAIEHLKNPKGVLETETDVVKAVEQVQNGADNLVPPNVNLIILKCSDEHRENKLSAKTSTETVANGPSNQIHVKFEAELHLLNDFNDSLRQIMNIEKSMLDLQTKYNLPASRETRDTQTSIMSPPTRSSNNSSSIIEKSINFSRGSDPDVKPLLHKISDKTTLLTDNSINISDIAIASLNNTTQSTQNALTLNTLNASRDIDTPDKLNSAGISLGMFNQLIRDEDARIENLKTVLKIREKALLDRTKSELTWLEIQKKHLLETGKLHEASLLKKKQRGIILKLQEETNEMQRLKEAQKAASKERKSKLKEQRALIKAQLSGPHVITRIKRSSERRTSGPVKVYQSDYYQSETSISRKSSISESVVYTSRAASILSRRSDSHHDNEAPRLEPTAATSRTEMAKRSLQMREAALQKRRKEAEDLLKWHQKLLKEERKIADLEMAASNVINQVPAADGDKYAYKSSAPAIWVDMSAAKKQKSDTSLGKSKGINDSSTSLNLKGYSMEFDTDKEDGTLEKGIKHSESTLNEIMHNINNITDEISELYKISSIKKSAANQLNSIIDTIHASDSSVSDGSDSRSSKASIINKQRDKHSVPEVSVISERLSSVVSNDAFLEIPSKDVIGRSDSKSDKILAISNVALPAENQQQNLQRGKSREETEEDVSSIQSEVFIEREISSSKENLDRYMEVSPSLAAEESLFESIKINKTVASAESLNTEIASENHTTAEEINDEIINDKGDYKSEEDLLKTTKSYLLQEPIVSNNRNTNKSLIQSRKDDVGDESIVKSAVSQEETSSVLSNKSADSNSELSFVAEIENGLALKEIESLDSISTQGVSATIKEVESLPYSKDINEDTIDGNQEDALKVSISQRSGSKSLSDTLAITEAHVSLPALNNISNSIDASIPSEKDISRELKSDIESIPEVIEKLDDSPVSEHNLISNEEIDNPESEDSISIEVKSDTLSKLSLGGKEVHVITNEFSQADGAETQESVTPSKLIVKIVELIPEVASVQEETENESIQEQTITINEDIFISEQFSKDILKLSEIDSVDDADQKEELASIVDAIDSIKVVQEKEDSIQDLSSNEGNDFAEDTLVAEDIEQDTTSESSTLKSHSPDEAEDSLPIIGIKIEEKRPAIEEEKENVDDSESVKESVHETSITDVDEDSKKSIDVKKRVSEILADANLNASIEEKSPRLPDIYVTTYDVITPDNSPELGSPVDNSKALAKPKDIYGIGNEAQELLKKQLAIEQEIKQIERQQKQQLPYIFVREIPNKPPPPYTPPVQQHTSIVPSTSVQIEEIVPHLAEVFFHGYVDKTLEYVTFPHLKIDKLDNVDKLCAEFLFDICKEIAVKHYRQFVENEEETVPWMTLKKRQNFKRPHTKASLESMFKKKLNQLFGFEKIEVKESMIIKWSRKRRDNVDELLVAESQAEEAEWTNYDQDELIVKDEVTNSLLDILIGETVKSLQDIVKKRQASHC